MGTIIYLHQNDQWKRNMAITDIKLQADYERADKLVAKMMIARDEAVDVLCDANYDLQNAFEAWGLLNERINGTCTSCEQPNHPA
jgi:hypothetical protein